MFANRPMSSIPLALFFFFFGGGFRILRNRSLPPKVFQSSLIAIPSRVVFLQCQFGKCSSNFLSSLRELRLSVAPPSHGKTPLMREPISP